MNEYLADIKRQISQKNIQKLSQKALNNSIREECILPLRRKMSTKDCDNCSKSVEKMYLTRFVSWSQAKASFLQISDFDEFINDSHSSRYLGSNGTSKCSSLICWLSKNYQKTPSEPLRLWDLLTPPCSSEFLFLWPLTALLGFGYFSECPSSFFILSRISLRCSFLIFSGKYSRIQG